MDQSTSSAWIGDTLASYLLLVKRPMIHFLIFVFGLKTKGDRVLFTDQLTSSCSFTAMESTVIGITFNWVNSDVTELMFGTTQA